MAALEPPQQRMASRRRLPSHVHSTHDHRNRGGGMIDVSLAISTPHHRQLRDSMFPDNGHEAGAIVLCGISNVDACPWANRRQRRYLSREVIPIPESDIVSSSDRHFEWRKTRFLAAYKQAREDNV